MTQDLSLHFSDAVSETQSTRERLDAISHHLRVTPEQAVHIAINAAYNNLSSDIAIDHEFATHGHKIGKIAYLNTPDDVLARIKARIAKGIPLPHEDDDELESNLLFHLLSDTQQAQVRAIQDPLKKRHLISGFLGDNKRLSIDV